MENFVEISTIPNNFFLERTSFICFRNTTAQINSRLSLVGTSENNMCD